MARKTTAAKRRSRAARESWAKRKEAMIVAEQSLKVKPPTDVSPVAKINGNALIALMDARDEIIRLRREIDRHQAFAEGLQIACRLARAPGFPAYAEDGAGLPDVVREIEQVVEDLKKPREKRALEEECGNDH